MLKSITIVHSILLAVAPLIAGCGGSSGSDSVATPTTSESAVVSSSQNNSDTENTDQTTSTEGSNNSASTPQSESETEGPTEESDEPISIAVRLTYPIVDTDQTECFDSTSGNSESCSGQGQDADYAGNQPAYRISGDGLTVTDTVTELVWQQSSDINNDGTLNIEDKMLQSDALSYCSNLNYGGRADWRLPNIKEAYSLIAFSGLDPSGYSGTDTSELTPFLNSALDWAFGDIDSGERIIDGQYATSTEYVSTTMNNNATMFGVNFVDGRIKGYPLYNKLYYVRCVAGNSEYGVNQFVDNQDESVTDQATGLMWQRQDSESTSWNRAISLCESSTTAGYDDWRLPNVKELHSLVDYSRSPDTHNNAAIDPIFHATSIINEEGATDWGAYWSSTTHANYLGNSSAAAYINFGRSLGYMNGNILDVHGAGAQRSDHKTDVSSVRGASSDNVGFGTFFYHGPQGDILRNNNMVRCVRNTHQTESFSNSLPLNILLIVGDDIGVDNISGYEEQPEHSASTPILDELANQGSLFRNVWANPLCSPSRASLLTGRYALHHRVTHPGGATGQLSSSEETIAEILQQAGYKTALFGKWHLGTRDGLLPTDQGFDFYTGSLDNLTDYFLWEKTTISPENGETETTTESSYATKVVAEDAAQWIAETDSPWFVEVAFNAPHSPFHVPPKNKFSSRELRGDTGDNCSPVSIDSVTDCYRAAAEAMDTYIGELLDSIPAEQLANTLIIFVGDNGTPGQAVIATSDTPFTRSHSKGTVYEGGVNVPLIIAGGTNVPIAHREIDELVQIQDLFPTIAELTATDVSHIQLDGVSLRHHIDQQMSASPIHETLYTELDNDSDINRWAVSNGVFKYINNEGNEECYALLADPAESTNLYGSGTEPDAVCNSLKTLKPED